jgi:amino acid adenylation domain-containing protein
LSATADFGKKLQGLSAAQRALLERQLMDRRAGAAKRNPVARREVVSPAPLSYSQELLWLLSQVFGDGVAYNVPGAYRLQGPLDVSLLQRALDALIDRHEILRTTYSVIGDGPMQVIHERMRVDVKLIDLSGQPHDEQEAQTAEILRSEAINPFDLERGPVLRPTLIRHAPDDHVFMLVLHHVATDGFSRAVLYRDLTALYDAFAAGEESTLEPLTIQYADFAVWHRRWLDEGAAEQQLAYWTGKLGNLPSRLELPTDFQRPRSRAYVGDFRNQMIDLSVRESLRTLARRSDATLFVALVALFGTLLHRYAGQDDIVVGTPFAGRNRTEFEEMVGYFINPLPLRLDVSGDPSFAELVGRTRGTVLEAFANADVPFETIVRETNPTRDLSQTPVFQAMIVLHNPAWETRRPKFEPKGIHATEMTHEKGWSKFDLLLGMSERTAGLNTTWEYSTELFEDSTVERMMGHFRTLAESVVANPETPVSRLSMLSDDERRRVLASSGARRRPAEAHESVKDLFEEQVRRSPEAPAVVFESERLSYDELNRFANRVAWRLKEHGVGPGSRIGIMMGKSRDLVPAVLGVVKAGGAYIPLDPQYPKDRLEFMLQDARPEVVLTQTDLLGEVDVGDAMTIAVEELRHDGGREDDPPTVTDGDDLAYIIYTSGSTGRPKGALITNRSLASAHFAYKEAYRLPELQSHLQMASFSFDVFTGDWIRSLLCGARLVLCPLETVVDPQSLFDLMRRESVDAAEFVPATATMLFDWAQQNGERLDFMKLVIVSSEAWRTEQYAFFRGLCGPETRLINSYGLTEATIDSTWYEASPDEPLVAGRFVPIGRPLSNTTVYILDGSLEPMPIGIPGELCIGGLGVAQGYLNRPELTAERFVPNPFDDGMLYRTGDLARWLPDGGVDFIGRADRQLKIRGFRIEPGEIEAVLERHPGVARAVVTTRADARGDARLVAYYTVARESAPVGPEELRDFISEHVPAYMVPTSWAVVDSFAVTPNGKVNMDALPEPQLAVSRVSQPLETDTERKLGEIWQRLLELDESPGADDDFFSLGGHSLLAVRLVSEIERGFRVRVPIATLFKGATIRHLAETLEEERGSREAWSSLVPIREGGSRTPLFLGPYLDGDVYGYHALVDRLDEDQPVYGLQSLGLDGRVHPHDRIEDMASHYVKEMRELQPHGPYLLAGYCFGGVVAYAMAAELHELGEEVALLALIDAGPMGYRRAAPKTRAELERARLNKFRQADIRGKLAVVGHLLPGLRYKVHRKTRWALYDLFVRTGVRLPRALQDVKVVNRRASSKYVTPPSACKVTLFRAEREATESYYRLGFWAQLAGGGVDVRPIEGEGITHFEIMKEPHVEKLAAELTRCIAEALDGAALERTA